MRLCCAYLELGLMIFLSGLRMFYFFETSEKAEGKYKPLPYEGSVALLVAHSSADDSPVRLAGIDLRRSDDS